MPLITRVGFSGDGCVPSDGQEAGGIAGEAESLWPVLTTVVVVMLLKVVVVVK